MLQKGEQNKQSMLKEKKGNTNWNGLSVSGFLVRWKGHAAQTNRNYHKHTLNICKVQSEVKEEEREINHTTRNQEIHILEHT